MKGFERLTSDGQRILLAHLEDPVAVLSPRGRIVYFNPPFARSFRVELKTALGKALDQVAPEWMSRTVLQHSSELAAAPRPHNFWLRGPSERFRASLAPIVLNGRFLGSVLSLWDAGKEVAHRRQNFELFRFMLNDMHARVGSEAGADGDDGAGLREGLNRLREFSEVFFGEVHPALAPFHPDRLVAMTLRSMRLVAESRKVTLEEGLGRELPRLRGDAGLLSRALALLADYMIRRAPAGQLVVLSAEVLAGRKGHRLAYSVTGLGVVESASWLSQKGDVPADYATLSDEQKNHGLRLIMAKRLVQAMDGRVTVAAHESVGTTICAQVPVEVVEEPGGEQT